MKALEAGFDVIGTVRSRQRAAKEVEHIEQQGGKRLELDVTNADACWDVFAEAEKVYGRIDVLINNAGMSWLDAVEDFTYVYLDAEGRLQLIGCRDVEAKAQMEVNFYGPLRFDSCCVAWFPKAPIGAIVNITSVASIDGLPSCGLYAASKFALEGKDVDHVMI